MKCIKYIPQILLLIIVCNDVHAQVPVIKEPHHKPVLVNKYVRLLNVYLNAGDTTQYHIHAAPSVIVMISNSTIGMQKSGEAPSAPGNVTAGATSFVDYEKNPVTHRVYNSGNNIFHVMDIELAKKIPLQIHAMRCRKIILKLQLIITLFAFINLIYQAIHSILIKAVAHICWFAFQEK
jgi:hypothetical protein